MTGAEQRRAMLARHFELYNRGHDEPDVAAEWASLFTPDCTTEEPVGTPVRAGVMVEGWDRAHSDGRRVWLDPVLVVAAETTPECASVVRVRIVDELGESESTAVGVWRFAADGRIAGARIFVDSDRLGPDAWGSDR